MNCWSEFGGCSVMLNGGFCGGGFVWFHWLFWSISARKEVVFWSWGCGFEVVVSFFGVVSSPEKMMRMRGEAGQRGFGVVFVVFWRL
uniref:Transmembrane protein n=1 Tax=Solanum tuberosum TaxID=4113 RepID=M0ZH72_SOLTU